ncbi:hypothetical protein ACHAWF_007431 [Thalassiosira exigua]
MQCVVGTIFIIMLFKAMTISPTLAWDTTFNQMTRLSYTHWYRLHRAGNRIGCSSFPSSVLTPLSMSSSPHPNWEHITNHQTSKTVKLFKSIHRANKAKRSELGLTVAEGIRLVCDVLADEASRRLVRRVVVSSSVLQNMDKGSDDYQQKLYNWIQVLDQESRQGKTACFINIGSDKVVEACSGTVTSQGVVALVEIPAPLNPLTLEKHVHDTTGAPIPPFFLILDGLSDPGNVGTLLRTCAASCVTALVLLPGSCDVWNPKAVRSAMGSSFRVPILDMSRADEKGSLDQLLEILEKSCGVSNQRVFAATMEAAGDNASLPHYGIDFASNGGAAVILGKEGEGLRSEVRDAVEQNKISTVHVPMAKGVESLNAAVCGSVIIFERMRQLQAIKDTL